MTCAEGRPEPAMTYKMLPEQESGNHVLRILEISAIIQTPLDSFTTRKSSCHVQKRDVHVAQLILTRAWSRPEKQKKRKEPLRACLRLWRERKVDGND